MARRNSKRSGSYRPKRKFKRNYSGSNRSKRSYRGTKSGARSQTVRVVIETGTVQQNPMEQLANSMMRPRKPKKSSF